MTLWTASPSTTNYSGPHKYRMIVMMMMMMMMMMMIMTMMMMITTTTAITVVMAVIVVVSSSDDGCRNRKCVSMSYFAQKLGRGGGLFVGWLLIVPATG